MSNNLCRFQNVFGESGKGFHKYRVFNIAAFDFLGTILLAAIVFYVAVPKNMQTFKTFTIVLVSMFLLGVICHRLFCVQTTIDKLLFG